MVAVTPWCLSFVEQLFVVGVVLCSHLVIGVMVVVPMVVVRTIVVVMMMVAAVSVVV
jgi:hypothetical protein